MGSSHQGFYPNAPFFQDGVIKPGELLSTFQKKQKNEFICVKFVIILIFCNEKVPCFLRNFTYYESHLLIFESQLLIFPWRLQIHSYFNISDDKVAEINKP